MADYVNGNPEEHFLKVLHVHSIDAGTIAEALQSFLQQKQFDLRKLISQGYDGAATFAGKIWRSWANSDLLCLCNLHPLFLSQVTARFSSGSCISEGDKDVFETMTSVWKLFYCSLKKAEALKGIKGVLGYPELKIVKPSDTRWLSHELCVTGICKELPPFVANLSQLYEASENLRHMVYTPFGLE